MNDRLELRAKLTKENNTHKVPADIGEIKVQVVNAAENHRVITLYADEVRATNHIRTVQMQPNTKVLYILPLKECAGKTIIADFSSERIAVGLYY